MNREYELIKEILTEEVVKCLLLNNLETVNKTDLEQHINKTVILAKTPEGTILSFALISETKEINLEEEMREALMWLYSNDYNFIEENTIPKLKDNGVVLKAVEAIVNGLGTGTAIVDQLKEEYNSIWLYSKADAEEYWENKGFEDIGDYNYLWTK